MNPVVNTEPKEVTTYTIRTKAGTTRYGITYIPNNRAAIPGNTVRNARITGRNETWRNEEND